MQIKFKKKGEWGTFKEKTGYTEPLTFNVKQACIVIHAAFNADKGIEQACILVTPEEMKVPDMPDSPPRDSAKNAPIPEPVDVEKIVSDIDNETEPGNIDDEW